MPFVVWDNSYSVNVKQCDTEHQKLFSLLNALHHAMMAGSGRSIIGPVVADLGNYTKTHFQAEEALMQKAAYPALAGHRSEHHKFIVQVDKLQKDMESGHGASAIEAFNFLKDWLASHIKQTDRLYSAHLNAKGIR